VGPVVLDTSIYIASLRAGDDAVLKLRRYTAGTALWLSAVVLEELYAGLQPRDSRIVERLERDFDKAGRMLVPNLNDWTLAGKLLARLAAKYDYERIGQARLTNDALLAMSAARCGITIITANERDFGRLAQFTHSVGTFLLDEVCSCSLSTKSDGVSLASPHGMRDNADAFS
jgi:predicted nucleic acid-binding protein